MNLSRYLSFETMTHTDYAGLQEANRAEGKIFIPNMCDFGRFVFDKLCEKWGNITMSSGFRGPSLNKQVHGEKYSLHCFGKAGDCQRPDWTWTKLDEVCLWLPKSGIVWGEAVREKRTKTGSTWLHITSPAPGNHMELWDGIDGKYTARR